MWKIRKFANIVPRKPLPIDAKQKLSNTHRQWGKCFVWMCRLGFFMVGIRKFCFFYLSIWWTVVFLHFLYLFCVKFENITKYFEKFMTHRDLFVMEKNSCGLFLLIQLFRLCRFNIIEIPLKLKWYLGFKLRIVWFRFWCKFFFWWKKEHISSRPSQS